MLNDNERFFVHPDSYLDLRYGGESVSDEKKGIERTLKFYESFGMTETQLQEDVQKCNLNQMLQLVQDYFKREYEYNDPNIVLSNRYQHSVNSYVKGDENRPDRNLFIHIDELFESALLSFFMVMFKWAKEFDDIQVYRKSFLYLLFIMNDVSILGDIPNENSSESLFEILNGDWQIMNLASSCYWVTVIFSLAHEVAHTYFKNKGQVFESDKEEEFAADAMAYDIVLKIIMDQVQLEETERILEAYAYLAPVMYMQFFDVLYYTDNVLYNGVVIDDTHPPVQERVDQLLAIADEDRYDFDTEEGNSLYNSFLDVYEEYCKQLYVKKEEGKLNKIIRMEDWERRYRKYDKNRG